MDTGADSRKEPALPSILFDAPEEERERHKEFLHRHIDFLNDVLTAEQCQKHWDRPWGCPGSTPEVLARRKNAGETYPCQYRALTNLNGSAAPGAKCDCGDPLAGSDDPLDTVAAVAIARNDRSPAERYFDNEERSLIAELRQQFGAWTEIATFDRSGLRDALEQVTERPGIGDYRVDRLKRLLTAVEKCPKTEGVTLSGISALQYESFCDLLAELPGLSRSDAWWLLLVAFDKPVWPSDPYIDGLLCSLGLLDIDRFQDGSERREELEEELIDRQIGSLHRALAGHAVKGKIDSCSEDCEIRKFLLTHRLRKQSEARDGPSVMDLFCGAGGISLGFSRAGCRITYAIDNNRDATDTYRLNHPEIPHQNVLCEDIRNVDADGDSSILPSVPDIIVGGPPCQSLSQAGFRSRKAKDKDYSILEDDRTSLYTQYVEFVEKLRPKVIVMENVEGMVNEVKDTGIKVGDLVLEALESIGGVDSGYVCEYRLIDCSELGIPQERERVIVLGIREDIVHEHKGVEPVFDKLMNQQQRESVDLRQGLSGLPKIRRGEGGRVVTGLPRGKRSTYIDQNSLDSGTSLCFNHRARRHPMEKDKKLFDEAMEPGDTGWDVKYRGDEEYSHLITYDVGTEDEPRFKDKYRMLCWDKPSPTIVAHLAKDANSFILPDYYKYVEEAKGEADNRRNRGITPREAARLQSFPDQYLFLGSFTSWFRQIGNAIPPLLGEQLAEILTSFLEQEDSARQSVDQPMGHKAETDD